MNLERKIRKLEEKISKMHIDPSLAAELTEWFKSLPGYLVFAQPESNNGVVMPEHLSQAFGCIIDRIFVERKLQPSLCNFLKILDRLSETFNGYAIF